MQGLLIINKPEGITSFGAVARVRRLAKTKRVGHTGTLDPMATGVLPIFVGRATALSSFLLDADKGYSATFLFGKVTDTDDITGKVIAEKAVNITKEQVLAVLNEFVGEISQVPPAFSAIKQDGVPMYKRARKGEEVQIPARQVTVFSITPVSELENNEITVEIKCSKGTYIRSLCRDVGERLGCGATLKTLRRDFTSGFSLRDSVNLEDLTGENIENYLIGEENAVQHLRRVGVSEKQGARFLNGGKLSMDRLYFTPTEDGENVRICHKNELLGIGEVDLEKQEIRIKCLLKANEPRPKTAVALGTFDGVHLGHLAVLELAKGSGFKSVAVSFPEPPKSVISGNKNLLTTPLEKKEILEKSGIEQVNYLDFAEICNYSPEQFLEYIIKEFNVGAVCCGFNYRFGKGGSGDTNLIKNFCQEKNIKFFMAEPRKNGEEIVSSTLIRGLLGEGRVMEANSLLSEPFGFSGEIVHGDKRGRTIGFPTINQLYPENKAPLRFGVYKTEVTVLGKTYKGITNIGHRPSFPSGEIIAETHILDFSGEVYGQTAKISFLRFIRDEQRFDDIEELKSNIKNDIEKAQ